ncbi:MAG: diguanylate cyclase [Cyanobacteria bacterium J06623_7]
MKPTTVIYEPHSNYTRVSSNTIILTTVIFIGALINWLIIRSVRGIAKYAQAIAQDKTGWNEPQLKIKELVILRESIHSIALQLQNSRQNITELRSKCDQRIAETTKTFQTDNQRLNRLAHIDGLTQVFNRYYFDKILPQLWKLSIQEYQPISLIMCDVDSFKLYNDTYGHLMGDKCLTEVAQAILRGANRQLDVVARYGGEEFAVILPHTDAAGVAEVAKKLLTVYTRSI